MCFTLIHALPPFEDPTYLTSTVLGSMAHGLDRSLIDWSIERLSRHVPCSSLDARGKQITLSGCHLSMLSNSLAQRMIILWSSTAVCLVECTCSSEWSLG